VVIFAPLSIPHTWNSAQQQLIARLRIDSEHDNSMSRNLRFISLWEDSKIVMRPKIAYRCGAIDPKVFPLHLHFRRLSIAIEEQNGLR
jgi:hypothetical protein